MTDAELIKLLEKHAELQAERINDLENKIIEVDAKLQRQLKGSNFDFKAYLGLGIGTMALIFLFSISFSIKNGKANFSYQSDGLLQAILSVMSVGGAGWGGIQHYKALKEKKIPFHDE
ncbi:MAG: hypothetical protein ACRDBG_07845 [Waterburya sp.]